MKNSNYTIGNQTRELTACRAVPQPTAPPYVDEIIGVHQCALRRTKSASDYIFCFCQILELFIQFKKAYNSVRWEVSYNILIEFVIRLKLDY